MCSSGQQQKREDGPSRFYCMKKLMNNFFRLCISYKHMSCTLKRLLYKSISNLIKNTKNTREIRVSILLICTSSRSFSCSSCLLCEPDNCTHHKPSDAYNNNTNQRWLHNRSSFCISIVLSCRSDHQKTTIHHDNQSNKGKYTKYPVCYAFYYIEKIILLILLYSSYANIFDWFYRFSTISLISKRKIKSGRHANACDKQNSCDQKNKFFHERQKDRIE